VAAPRHESVGRGHQRRTQRGGNSHGFGVVDLREEIDVVGCAVDEAVDDHRAAACERHRAGFGQVGSDADDQVLQRVERHGSGCGAGAGEEWEPGRADMAWEVHLIPHLDKRRATDELDDVIEGALDENDLVEVAATVGVRHVPADVLRVGTRPEQRHGQADDASRGAMEVGERARYRHVPDPSRSRCGSLRFCHMPMVPYGPILQRGAWSHSWCQHVVTRVAHSDVAEAERGRRCW
jgi:hypothetical protein